MIFELTTKNNDEVIDKIDFEGKVFRKDIGFDL